MSPSREITPWLLVSTSAQHKQFKTKSVLFLFFVVQNCVICVRSFDYKMGVRGDGFLLLWLMGSGVLRCKHHPGSFTGLKSVKCNIFLFFFTSSFSCSSS